MSASLTYVSCIHIATARGEEDRMGSPHQTPSLIHDPLGLLALPMTALGYDPPDDAPRPGAKSWGMAIAANMLGGAMVALLVAAGLVSLPGPTNDVRTSSPTAVWKYLTHPAGVPANHGWFQSALAPLLFASHQPL